MGYCGGLHVKVMLVWLYKSSTHECHLPVVLLRTEMSLFIGLHKVNIASTLTLI